MLSLPEINKVPTVVVKITTPLTDGCFVVAKNQHDVIRSTTCCHVEPVDQCIYEHDHHVDMLGLLFTVGLLFLAQLSRIIIVEAYIALVTITRLAITRLHSDRHAE